MADKKIPMPKIGSYFPQSYLKGSNEMCGERKMREGAIWWTVVLEKGEFFDTESQDTAEILSRLVKIEKMLKK